MRVDLTQPPGAAPSRSWPSYTPSASVSFSSLDESGQSGQSGQSDVETLRGVESESKTI
jgi:hypothetical protein